MNRPRVAAPRTRSAAIAAVLLAGFFAAETFHFTDVTLTDGSAVYQHAQVTVRVRSSAGGGYTRADYLDQSGHKLGFYETFEVVSNDEAALRAWAVRHFPERTSSIR